MPKVNNKHFSYTKSGYKSAEKARAKMADGKDNSMQSLAMKARAIKRNT